MKRILSVLIVIACTVALPVIADEPTHITGPLTAEGYIDYLKALEERFYPPEMKTDDNGFRVFVRIFGDAGSYYSKNTSDQDREFYRLQKYEKLGLDPNVPPTMTLPDDPYTFLTEHYKSRGEEIPRPLREPVGNPWTLEEYPMFTDWIKEIDKPIDAIAEAIRKPVFAPPSLRSPESVETGIPQNLITLLVPDLQLSRSIARILQARAGYRIGQGNIDGAIDDKLTAHRLGRCLPQGGCVVQHLIGIAIEGMAAAIPVGANPEHPLTAQQIRRILAGLDALPPKTSCADAYEWERHSTLSVIQEFKIAIDQKKEAAIADMFDIPPVLLNVMGASSFNWDVVRRRVNEAYDAMQEPLPREKFKALMEAVEKSRENGFSILARLLMTADGREMFLADMLIALLLPAMEAFEEAVWRAECMENMQRLVLAILLYQLENGKMPDKNWAAQIEKYLGENAEQYFSCPSNPSPEGHTTYALVQYGDTVVGSHELILLVELTTPVPLSEAVISVDEVLARQRTGSAHSGGMNVAYRSGAVRFLSASTNEKELRRMLGRE